MFNKIPKLVKIPIVIFLYSFAGYFLFFQGIDWLKIGLFWLASWVLFTLVCYAVDIDLGTFK